MRLVPRRPALAVRLGACGLLVAATALTGCAASQQSTVDAATARQEVADARDAVRKAQSVGADADAPTELRAATTRLARAEAALAEDDPAAAVRHAREAAVDGRLAELTVLAARAREAGALYREVRALRALADTAMTD